MSEEEIRESAVGVFPKISQFDAGVYFPDIGLSDEQTKEIFNHILGNIRRILRFIADGRRVCLATPEALERVEISNRGEWLEAS